MSLRALVVVVFVSVAVATACFVGGLVWDDMRLFDMFLAIALPTIGLQLLLLAAALKVKRDRSKR